MAIEPKPASSAEYSSVEHLDSDTCWRLVAAAPVARIGLIRVRRPVVLPINHAVVDRTLVYSTSADAVVHPVGGIEDVCIEVDGVDAERRLGWSVVITGRAATVRAAVEAERLATAVDSWAPGHRDVIVKVEVLGLSGRQVVRTAGERLTPPGPDLALPPSRPAAWLERLRSAGERGQDAVARRWGRGGEAPGAKDPGADGGGA